MKRFGAVLLAVAIGVTGCGGGSSSSSRSKAAGVSVTAHVAIIYNNFLGQSCEALTGNFKALHRGAVVTLEDSASQEVGRSRLGPPPLEVPTQGPPGAGGLCAWGAEVQATVQKGETYTFVVGNRWTKSASASMLIEGKRRVVLVAK